MAQKDNKAKKSRTSFSASGKAERMVAKAKAMHEQGIEITPIFDEDEPKMSFKDLTFRQKLDHIWYYYKWYFAGTVFAAICIASIIYTMFIKVKPDLWCGVAIYGENLPFEQTDLMTDELEAKFLTDTEHEEIQITNYYEDEADVMVAADLNQKFNTYIYAGQINMIVGTEEATQTFAEAEYIVPLTDYIPAEEIKKLEEKGMIFYATFKETNKKEPMAVIVNNSSLLHKYGIFTEQAAYLSFVPMSENAENTVSVMYEFMK